MNTYFDSSALVKALVRETDRDRVVALLDESSMAAISPLGYVECRAAIARLLRDGYLNRAEEQKAARDLDERWATIAAIELDDVVRREAGSLVRRHPLRGSGAVHLASALSVAEDPGGFRFACWDRRLWDAAAATGFQMVPEARP